MTLTATQKAARNQADTESNIAVLDEKLNRFWLTNRHLPIAVDYIVHAGNARNIKAVAENLYEHYTNEWFGGWTVYLDHKEDSKGFWTAARLVFPGANHAY